MEFREVYGVTFSQKRNDALFTSALLTDMKAGPALTEEAKRDLVLASIAIKYTQSNSVGFSKNGQMIGIGAGQQSRVDCVKLAGRKVSTWYLRQHPKVQALPFKAGVKRQDRYAPLHIQLTRRYPYYLLCFFCYCHSYEHESTPISFFIRT